MSLRLLGVPGSVRPGSLNHALLRAISETLPAEASLEIYDGLAALPTFDPDLDDEAPSVTLWRRALAVADGVVIATPEYNYSIPGVLKNAIDWAALPPSSPLRGKAMGLVSATTSSSGGMRAQYHLRQILVYTNSAAMLQPEVILPRAHERFDADGHLVDVPTCVLLTRFGVELATWIKRFQD
jgi:chromate reductase